MKNEKFIEEAFGSVRRFRTEHRKALRQLDKALDAAWLGCAHAPSYAEILKIRGLLNDAIEKCRVARWDKAHAPK